MFEYKYSAESHQDHRELYILPGHCFLYLWGSSHKLIRGECGFCSHCVFAFACAKTFSMDITWTSSGKKNRNGSLGGLDFFLPYYVFKYFIMCYLGYWT